jgi:ribosomal protein S12 methylthiotransferase
MGRGMTAGGARQLVQDLREAIPPIVLRGTFLLGFPGETDRDFRTLTSFAEEAGFPRGGVFRWSPQEGTPAARLKNRVPARTADRRLRRIRTLLGENARRFNQDRLGRTLTVVVDEADEDATVARSFAEAPDVDPVIYLPPGIGDPGSFLQVRITGQRDLDLVGEVTPDPR